MEEWKEFKAKKDEYYEMLEYVMGVAEEAGMKIKQQTSLELGFEEAAANIINYAYEEGEGEIYIKVYKEGEKFVIELKDKGKPFNPLQVEVKEEEVESIEDVKIGGLGIAFMQRIFDELTYHYGKEGELYYNHLKLGITMEG